MADVKNIQLPDGTVLNLKTSQESLQNPMYNTSGIFYVIATGTSSAWVSNLQGLTDYYDGLKIVVYNNTGSNSTTTVTLNINELGAKRIYRYGTTSISAILAGSMTFMVYRDGVFICDTYVNSTYNLHNVVTTFARPIVDNNGVHVYSLCGFTDENKLSSFTTTSGTATDKSPVNLKFKIGSPILYRSASISPGQTASNYDFYISVIYFDIRYSMNYVAARVNASTQIDYYMKVSISESDGTFTPIKDTRTVDGLAINDHIVVKSSARNELEAGNFYIFLGHKYNHTTLYYTYLSPIKTIYYYNGTDLIEYDVWKTSQISGDFVPITGGTMTGNLVMSGINGIQFGNAAAQSKIKIKNSSSTQDLNILEVENDNGDPVRISGVEEPETDNEAVNRFYIDNSFDQLKVATYRIPANSFVFKGVKGLYPANNSTTRVRVSEDFGIMVSLASYTANSSVRKLYDKVTVSSSLFGFTGVTSDNQPVYLTGYYDDNDGLQIYSKCVGFPTYSNVLNTYIYVGEISSDGLLRINTSHSHFITIDSNYKIVRIDGKELNGGGSQTTVNYNNPIGGESENLNCAENLSVGDIVVKIKNGHTNGGFLCKFNSTALSEYGYQIDFDWGYAMCVKAMSPGVIADKTCLMQNCYIKNQIYIDGTEYYIKTSDTVSDVNYMTTVPEFSQTDYDNKLSYLAYIGTGLSDNGLSFDASDHHFEKISLISGTSFISGINGRDLYVGQNYDRNIPNSSASLVSDISITNTSETDILSVYLSAGTWFITAHATIAKQTEVTAIQRGDVSLQMTDSGKSVVLASSSFAVPHLASTITSQNVSINTVVVISSAQYVYLRVILAATGNIKVAARTPTYSKQAATVLNAIKLSDNYAV